MDAVWGTVWPVGGERSGLSSLGYSRRGRGALSLTLFWGAQREVHPSLVMASGLAPTRAPHILPTAPCHYISEDAALPPGDGAVDIRAGWWARRDVVARGWVGGGWALVGARCETTSSSAFLATGGTQGEKNLYMAFVKTHHAPTHSLLRRE